MGIQNLLGFLKPFINPVHIKKYSGKRVGIDAYPWLHKGAYSCSMELCLGTQSVAARRYLKYFMHRINLLRHYNITPVVVFDGANIPSKSVTALRQKRREANLVLAKEKLKEGDIVSATEFFQKAVQVTPSMVHQLIEILRSENVEFIVAPYEADAQLAHLSTLDTVEGGIEAVITEDSDLIVYGCQAILFKMDSYGYGMEIQINRVFNTTCHGLCFKLFNKELFVGMCVLAGCDFLPSISGIGPKRAYSLILKYRNLERVLSTLKFDKKYQIPEDYADSFWKAVTIFQHALIYDAKTKSLKPLKPLEEKHKKALNGELDLLGPELPASIAAAIAEGCLNPVTMEAFNISSEPKTYLGITSRESWSLIKPSDNEQPFMLPTLAFPANLKGNKFVLTDNKVSDENKIDSTAYDEEKYMKEARALGRLIVPTKIQHPSIEPETVRAQVPNNNPFKKRKVESCSLKVETWSEDVVAFSNTEKSQVQKKQEGVATIGKLKIASMFKAQTNDKKGVNYIKRAGIFNFFQAL